MLEMDECSRLVSFGSGFSHAAYCEVWLTGYKRANIMVPLEVVGRWMITFLILFALAGPGLAQSNRSDLCTFVIAGQITFLSPQLVKDQYARLNNGNPGKCGHRFAQLNSDGGDVAAAIEIGMYLRTQGTWTIVPRNAVCASACVLVFLGGVHRITAGKLGIHRPYSPKLSESSTDSKTMFESLNLVVSQYLKQMNIPEAVLSAMNAVPPGEIKWLTREERERFQVDGTDPVWDDLSDSVLAKRIGITKQQLYERQQKAKRICHLDRLDGPTPTPDSVMVSMVECQQDVVWGRRK